MFVLLTTLYSILALGKILCQVQVSQEVRDLPSPFLPGRGNLPRHFHRSTPSLQTIPYSPPTTEKCILFVNKNNASVTTQQSANANQPKRRLFISRVKSRRMNHNRPFVNPVTTNSTNSSTQKNSNNATSDQNNYNNSTGAQNNTDIYDKVNHNRPFVNPVTNTNSTNSSTQNNSNNATSAQNNYNKSTGAQNNTDIYDKVIFEDEPPMEINSINSQGPANNRSSSGNTELKKSVTEIPLPANVTLEDRSSFDGDQCPTGYVRVNGMCVLPD